MTAATDKFKARLTAHLEKKLARRIAYRDKLKARLPAGAPIVKAQTAAIQRLRKQLGQQ